MAEVPTATPVHAFTDDALGDDDAVGLLGRLAAREVSAAELVEAAIARAEQVQPALNGVAHAAFEQARASARALPAGAAGAALTGLPTLVKDNVDVAGMPTQHGTASFRAEPAGKHGGFARDYLATGLVPLGKTRLSEFGFSASAEYPDADPVRNPWDPAYSSGASSAGSAALVAAGVVPLAHANDGGGSIRIPAAACGLVGLKPTRGRLRGDRLVQLMPVRIVTDGVVTRSVRDTAAFLREAERVHRNLALAPVGDVRRPLRRRLRVAVVTDPPGRRTDEETRETLLRTARLLEEQGHRVEEVEAPVPDHFEEDFALYWGSLAFAMVSGGRHTFGRSFDPALVDNLTRGLKQHTQRRAHRLPGAIARLRRARRTSACFFADHDAVLTPVLGHTTPRLGHLAPTQSFDEIMERLVDWVCFTPLQNATGDPAVSLPMGATAQGLPIGVQVAGPWGSERTLLELAYALEEARPFRRIDRVDGSS